MADHWDGGQENLYLKCPLRRIEFCKCSNGARHEFLIFFFGHWIDGSSAEAVICVDRTFKLRTQDDNSSKQFPGLVSHSSSEPSPALDSVSMVGSPQDAKPRLTQSHGPYTTLCTLRFSPSPAPSALEVSTVLFLVHQQAPVYDLIDSQCFWFSDTVWRSLKALFPINQELCNFNNHNSRARYGGFTVGPSDPSVQAVCNAYESEWQRVLKKVEQVKQCHEAELAQVLQRGLAQGRAERQMEINQLHVKQQSEIDRLRAEQRTELDRLRAERQHEVDQMRQMQAELAQFRAIMGVAASEGTRN
ncbi:uncharacterized protein F5891DRAFT_967222 [Suillus fuscotomentosus]|uniref:Uncharacterized protein n=1 Tax=Suillus fuscotomentosus TaxID=1912939 RepID=A0AAD4DNZ2_9AGAM|nr:uncharacterized protein F5891DRAFT_967222 [Suillus fuscotomentosus]KAG1887422.1 hypothetical protein F5891DRAFT_967222 [Suillus fuscotomentosus]